MDVKIDSGSFSHRHRRIAGHTGEIAAAVSVDWRDGKVAPGRYSLPVWQHFLLDKEEKDRKNKWYEVDGMCRI